MTIFCNFDECYNKQFRKGNCYKHHFFLRWQQDPDKWTCTVVDCVEPITSSGLCSLHQSRKRQFGNPEVLPATKPRGRKKPVGFVKEKDGYLFEKVSPEYTGKTTRERYVPQHRLIMEQHLARPLQPFPLETVHHINGDTKDNRIENLQLRTGSHGSGIVNQCLDCGSHNIAAVTI